MRTTTIVIAMLALLATGCLSPEERQHFRDQGLAAAAEIDALTALANDLAAKVKEGAISVADFTAAMAQINASKDKALALKAEADAALTERPWYDRLEAWLQIIIGGALGLGGATVTSRMRRGVSVVTGKTTNGVA